MELFVGCDQVNTPKVFTDRSGREVKWIEYDSFGIVLDDSRPELFIPVGFAGGLADRDTGFVRFGFRDYDPTVGRFTCPDPMGDTGGDHDLYDYCVDDPVNMRDPMGLFGEGGWTGFLQQQGLKEWETRVPKVDPEPQTTEDKRGIDGELEKTGTAKMAGFDQGPPISNNEGNILQSELGPYRGNQPSIHNDHPVVFDHIASTPDRGKKAMAGFFTPDKGIIGTIVTGADRQGTTRLVVHGDPETGKPSSWTMSEWKEIGAKDPVTGWSKYGWSTIPTAKMAVEKPGFDESMGSYHKYRKK